jgi:hypothetical protein
MSSPDRTGGARPVLTPGIPQYFIPPRNPGAAGLTYYPMIYGAAQVRYVEPKLNIDVPVDVAVVTPVAGGPVPADWNAATAIDVAPSDLEAQPAAGIGFVDPPAGAIKADSAAAWERSFATWVYGSQTLGLLQSTQSGAVSNPGESERDFRIRLQQISREARDAAVDDLRRKYAPKIAAAEERLRRTRQAVDRESEQAKAQTLQTAISFGTTLLGAIMGRKAVSASTLGRATTAARGVGRTIKESQDIGRAKETVEAVEQQIQRLDEELRAETAAIEARFDAASEPLERQILKPKRSNIAVRLVALVWAPHIVAADGSRTPVW